MKPMQPHESKLVYIVDDDDAVRDALSLLVESAGYEVEAFETAVSALESCRTGSPACIITDIRMPEMDGFEFQKKLSEGHVGTPVIVITGHGDVPLAVRAMKAGAADFIEKPFTDEAILSSIRSSIEPGLGGADEAVMERLESLTAREREVLEMLIFGHQNKMIAHRLAISPRTVEIHRARVMEKMKVRSLPELVRTAMQAGIAPQA
jgi:two-component system response regulator FixJ